MSTKHCHHMTVKILHNALTDLLAESPERANQEIWIQVADVVLGFGYNLAIRELKESGDILVLSHEDLRGLIEQYSEARLKIELGEDYVENAKKTFKLREKEKSAIN